MDDLLRPSFGKGKQQELPFEIRFGESQNSVLCQSCKVARRAGFFVIYGQYVILVCMQCTAESIMKYQETHLMGEKIFQVDAEIPPEVMDKITSEVIKEFPDIQEQTVTKIVRSAIDRI